MAKQILWVSLNMNGDQTNPSATGATFSYCVCDTVDTDMKKSGTYTVPAPNFGQTVDAFWDTHIAIIKTNEGIA
jgi:hypothetical protein